MVIPFQLVAVDGLNQFSVWVTPLSVMVWYKSWLSDVR